MRQRKEGQEIELKSSTICNMTNMIWRRDSSKVKRVKMDEKEKENILRHGKEGA